MIGKEWLILKISFVASVMRKIEFSQKWSTHNNFLSDVFPVINSWNQTTEENINTQNRGECCLYDATGHACRNFPQINIEGATYIDYCSGKKNQFMIQLDWQIRENPQHRMISMESIMTTKIKPIQKLGSGQSFIT